jgi:DNA primase
MKSGKSTKFAKTERLKDCRFFYFCPDRPYFFGFSRIIYTSFFLPLAHNSFMIDQYTIARIMDAARIVDVVSDFVTLKKRGVNMVGLCPFHDDKTPSFYVSPSKNICKCFSCGEGGTAVHFIMKHEQLNYAEALKYLAKKYNIEVEEREQTDEEMAADKERESLFILNEYANTYFQNTLHNTVEGKTIGLSYFRERGFRDDIIRKFQLGYSLEQRDALTQDAVKSGYKKDYLVKVGLTVERDNNDLLDRFRGRVMFPVHTLSGKVIAFGGRILKKVENTGKYINSPESPIYHKSDVLYGLYLAKQAITKADKCFLVEGYTDVISMHQAGIENVVASSGTSLTHGQIKLIHRFTTNVTVLYDGDAAGIKAALRGIDLLLEEGLNIKVVLLPDGEDPDSFARKQNADSFNNFIREHETDFIRFKTQLLLGEAGTDPIRRAALITDIANSIAIIPDNIIRSVYIKDCSVLLDIDERTLTGEVNRKRRALRDKKTDSRTVPPVETITEQAPIQDAEIPVVALPQKSPLDKFEYAILYYLVRYGNMPLYPADHPDKHRWDSTVLLFVKQDLERDGLWFQHPLYKQLLDESVANMEIADFVPSRYFLAHPDPNVSKLTAKILEDKYELSKWHIKQYGENLKKEDTPLAEERNLFVLVPRATIELKDAHISQRIKSTMTLLKEKESQKDTAAATELMQKIAELKGYKKIFAKALGERIILKW